MILLLINILFRLREMLIILLILLLAEDTNIIGEVIFKIPKIGYIQSILATKGGLIIVVLIPCLAILSYDIVKLGKNVKNKVVKKKSEVSIVRR